MRHIEDPAAIALVRLIVDQLSEEICTPVQIEGRNAIMFTADSRPHSMEKDGEFRAPFNTYWFFLDTLEARVSEDCSMTAVKMDLGSATGTVIQESVNVRFDQPKGVLKNVYTAAGGLVADAIKNKTYGVDIEATCACGAGPFQPLEVHTAKGCNAEFIAKGAFSQRDPGDEHK